MGGTAKELLTYGYESLARHVISKEGKGEPRRRKEGKNELVGPGWLRGDATRLARPCVRDGGRLSGR